MGRSLGQVEAPDEQTAIARAAEEFQLTPEQKKRVLVQNIRQFGPFQYLDKFHAPTCED